MQRLPVRPDRHGKRGNKLLKSNPLCHAYANAVVATIGYRGEAVDSSAGIAENVRTGLASALPREDFPETTGQGCFLHRLALQSPAKRGFVVSER